MFSQRNAPSRHNGLIGGATGRYLRVEPNELTVTTMTNRVVSLSLTSRTADSLRQTGMMLAITVVWAGLHIMKWAGKPL